MNDTLGIIMTGINDAVLGELTHSRSLAAVPVGGRYRLIDFMLSNMVNSGITNVGVPTLTYYRSLMDHLGSGKEWDLNRKLYGLFILPPFISRDGGDNSHASDLDILNGIMDYLARSKQKYVLLTGCVSVFNTTFYDLREFHINSGADISILCAKPRSGCAPLPRSLAVTADPEGRISDMEVGTYGASPDALSSMGIYFMEKSFLEHQISRCISRGMHDFVIDVILRGLSLYNIRALEFKGYVGGIDCVSSYYKESMRLLEPPVYAEVFNPQTPIYTKVKDQVPTTYGASARVKNCIVADGCRIYGHAENCIIFRGVEIGEGSHVTNSIVMQNSQIQKNVSLDYAVLDKNVVIRYSKRLMGQETYPVIIGKNAVI